MEEDSSKDLAEFALANAIYTALVEGHAAEISARRTAMENASNVSLCSVYLVLHFLDLWSGRTSEESACGLLNIRRPVYLFASPDVLTPRELTR